jgi:photosystem II stability/assembly factor-like uncharacterized protein
MTNRRASLWFTALLAVCVVLAAPASAFALTATGDGTWFWRSPQPQGVMLGAVCAQGGQLWAVGQAGTILHSSDDGATWQSQSSGVTAELSAVCFGDALHGWAVGGQDTGSLGQSPTSQVILRTVDGGATWFSQPAPGKRPLRALTFVDPLQGWAVGDGGAVVRTVDGGASWQAVATGFPDWLTCVHFVDSTHGWIGGPSGALLRTGDGGAHWRRARLGSWAGTDELIKPSFSDPLHGWAILQDRDGYSGTGSGSRLAVTSDGGLHWRPLPAPSGLEFSALVVDGLGELWVAADDDAGLTTFLRSSDGGAHWLREYADVPPSKAITACPGGLCAVGYSVLTRADGQAWLPRSSWTSGPLELQMFDDRDGVGLTDSYSAGGQSSFLRTLDGVNWVQVGELRAGYPTSLTFADSSHGLVLGTSGALLSRSMRTVVLATADGGTTWSRRNVGPKGAFPMGVSLPDAQHGWGVMLNANARSFAGAGLLFASSDGGQTWRREALPSGFIATAVHFRSALDGWLVGMVGQGMASAQTVDGGQHWTLSTTRVRGVVPETVSFLDAQHGWATGAFTRSERSAVLATVDGGVTWTLQDPASSYRDYGLSGVAFLDPLRGWLFAGDTMGLSTGGIWQTTDGGATWTREASGIGLGVSDASVADGQVYVCGLDGFLSTCDRAGDSAPPVTYDDFDGRYHRAAVAVRLIAADIGGGAVTVTQYRVDDDPVWHDATGAVEFAAPADHSGDGRHWLDYRSIDDSGNVEDDGGVMVPIDTLGPSTRAVGVATARPGATATLRYAVREQTSTRVSVQIEVRDAAGRRVKTLRVRSAPVGRIARVRFRCGLRPGRYQFTVFARDLAGNAQTHAGSGSLVVAQGRAPQAEPRARNSLRAVSNETRGARSPALRALLELLQRHFEDARSGFASRLR